MFSDSMILDQINRGRIKIEGGPPVIVSTDEDGELVPTDVLQPASYELTLGTSLLVPFTSANNEEWNRLDMRQGWSWCIKPGAFELATTAECVTLDSQVAARLEGKSSLARKGLVVHSTAGFIDPGFSGQITLELSNVGPWPIWLTAGMRIGQLTFEAVLGKVLRPYGTESLGSHYQNQEGAQPSRT